MAVKQALLDNIRQMLTPDTEDRRLAEERNKALEVTEDYGPLLIGVAMNEDINFAVRQMSLVLLKQYLNSHWDMHNKKFIEPLISDIDKNHIKEKLPLGLKDKSSKIRSGICAAMIVIVKQDWPQNWPQLLPLMHDYIHISNNESDISGALVFLEELIRVLDTEQIRNIGSQLLNTLFPVMEDTSNKFSKNQKIVALGVITCIISVIALSIDYPKDMFKTLIPKFLELVKHLLQNEKCLKFKNSLIKSLNRILPRATDDFLEFLPILLPSVWGELRSCGDMYLLHVASEYTDIIEDTTVNNEFLIDLSFSLFEFIQLLFSLIEKDKKMFVDVLPDIIYYVISFSVINKDLENELLSKTSCYMMDADKADSDEMSVRYSGIELIHYMCANFDHQPVVLAVWQAANKHLANVSQGDICDSEQRAYSLWWRVNEAIMYIICKMDTLFIEQYQANTLSNFDLRGYIMRWLDNDPNIRNNSFLFGRVLWMASHFSIILDTQEISAYVQTSTQYILSKNYIHVISSIKSITFHCNALQNSHNLQVIINVLPTITESLLSIVESADYNCLYLIIECLTTLVKLDKSFAATVESRVTPICIGIFLTVTTSPIVRTVTINLITELATNPNCSAQVQQRFIPPILEILQSPEEKAGSNVQSLALEALTILVKASQSSLSETMLKSTVFIVALTVMKSTDYITIQNGSDCIRYFLCVAARQVCVLVDSEGKPALNYIFDVIYYMLEPSTNPFSCIRIGRLFITLCNTGVELGNDKIEMTLRAVLSKLQRCDAEDYNITESLLCIFAHLFHIKPDAILTFLTTVPGPMGESALTFVLFRWLGMDVRPANTYEKKISFIGLCKLFEFCITNKDRRLDGVMVPGDLFVPPATSSKSSRNRRVASPERYYEVPALVRIFKVIVDEFIYQMGKLSHEGNGNEIPTLVTAYNFEQACDVLSLNEPIFSENPEYVCDIEEQDNEFPGDSINQINLLKYLVDFLRSFRNSIYFNSFYEILSDLERAALAAIGVVRQG